MLWWTPVAERGGVSRHVLDVATHGIPGVRLIVLCPEGPLAADLRARGRAVVTGPDGEPWTMDSIGAIAGTRRAHGIALSTMKSIAP